MPGFFKAPVKLPSSNNAIGDGGNTAGSYDSQGWDGYMIYLRLHLLQEHRGAVLLINADPRPYMSLFSMRIGDIKGV